MAKTPARDHAMMMFNSGIEFISGKWFYKDKEIKNIEQYLLRTGNFNSVNEMQDSIDFFRLCYGTTDMWKEMPIISEAKAQKELKPLCYPLNKKQLMIINYLLRHDEEIAFILTGVGGSGKSTFANIICQIFDNDTAALNLSDLSNDFKLATGINKRLIYSTEINSDEINNGILKQLFSNEELTINPKHEAPYKARCQSSFFFNCNIVPRLDLCDTGIMRRILYYGMNEKIQNPDPTLNKRCWTHSDMVNIVAHALSLDMTDWQKEFQEETRYYLVKDNSVYINRFDTCYSNYVDDCRQSGLRPYSEPKWTEIRKLLTDWGYIEEEEGIVF